MKRFIILASLLLFALPAFAGFTSLKIGVGTETVAIGAGDLYVSDAIEIDGIARCDGALSLSAGAVGTPSVYFTGSPTTGFYLIGPDDVGFTVGGVNVGEINAAGLTINGLITATAYGPPLAVLYPDGAVGGPAWSFTAEPTTGWYRNGAGDTRLAVLGADVLTALAAGVDITGTLSTTGVVDIPVGAVGAPSLFWTGDANCGLYHAGADDIGIAAAGADVMRITAAGVAVTGGITATNDFTFGQAPDDLAVGYKDRSNYITFVDTFDVGNDADLAVRWNIAGVVGLGTNDETTTDGWNELTTGAAGAGDMESTVSNGLAQFRAYTPRLEAVVELTDLVTQTFHFGFYAAANEYVEIIYEAATGANWLLRVDDTGGAETIDSTIPATVDPTKLEIRVSAAGAVTWAIDDVAMTVAGLTNLMTANGHYIRWAEYTTAAVAHTVDIDYVQVEQLKQQ